MTQPRRPLRGKKLLIASLGIGVLNLTDCKMFTSGNLPPPLPCDAGGYCEVSEDLSPPADDLSSVDMGAKKD